MLDLRRPARLIGGIVGEASGSPISPTAHYTGHVWRRAGLSPPELGTVEGRLMFEALQPAMAVAGRVGGVTLEGYLLARHRAIDALMAEAVDGGIGQVVELASGMSGRGWRFCSRYPELVYVETDLPAMADRKRAALARLGGGGAGVASGGAGRHRVVAVDALADTGPLSLAAVAGELDPSRGLVVITEGLLGYLPRPVVERLWWRIAGVLAGFAGEAGPGGVYLSDLYLRDLQVSPVVRAFVAGLSTFVRGGVFLHYLDAPDAQAAVVAAGFLEADVLRSDAFGAVAGDRRLRAGGRVSTVLRARA